MQSLVNLNSNISLCGPWCHALEIGTGMGLVAEQCGTGTNTAKSEMATEYQLRYAQERNPTVVYNGKF